MLVRPDAPGGGVLAFCQWGMDIARSTPRDHSARQALAVDTGLVVVSAAGAVQGWLVLVRHASCWVRIMRP